MKGEAMSKQTRQFMEQLKSGEEPSFAESIRDAASSLVNLGGKVWDGLAPTVNMGKSEISAALFSGSGYLMYGHSHGGASQGQAQEQAKEMPEDQRDLGREM
jgi:hypothetical protein